MPFNNSQVDELKLFFHYLQISSPDDEVELISLAAMISDAFWRKCWRWWQSWKIRIYYFRSMGFVWAICEDWWLEILTWEPDGASRGTLRMCFATHGLSILGEIQRAKTLLIAFQRWMQTPSFLWPTGSWCTEVARSFQKAMKTQLKRLQVWG